MPTPRMTDETCIERYAVYLRHHKSRKLAAEELGIATSTLDLSIEHYKSRGLHIDPAIKGGMDALGMRNVPPGGWVKSTTPDANGLTYSFRIPQQGDTDIVERLQEAFGSIPSAAPVTAPQHTLESLLTLYPIADAHIGMMAWGDEVGEDYDTKIAVDRITSWVGQAVASSPASDTAIILDVGDLNHADDQTSMTPRSKHILDVDTRHFKTLDLTIYALATAIDLARAKHAKVIVRILPGNHNPTSYMAVLFALAERYRNTDNVEVQKVPGEFFTHEFGKCLIAAHHGDKAKAERMVMFLADEYAQAWGRTQHRYLWTGHLHHHKSQDIGGVTWEQLRAVTARDAYASSHSYTARSQLQAITYHRDLGEVQRVKISGP